MMSAPPLASARLSKLWILCLNDLCKLWLTLNTITSLHRVHGNSCKISSISILLCFLAFQDLFLSHRPTFIKHSHRWRHNYVTHRICIIMILYLVYLCVCSCIRVHIVLLIIIFIVFSTTQLFVFVLDFRVSGARCLHCVLSNFCGDFILLFWFYNILYRV